MTQASEEAKELVRQFQVDACQPDLTITQRARLELFVTDALTRARADERERCATIVHEIFEAEYDKLPDDRLDGRQLQALIPHELRHPEGGR